jgi:hypothetical protein
MLYGLVEIFGVLTLQIGDLLKSPCEIQRACSANQMCKIHRERSVQRTVLTEYMFTFIPNGN